MAETPAVAPAQSTAADSDSDSDSRSGSASDEQQAAQPSTSVVQSSADSTVDRPRSRSRHHHRRHRHRHRRSRSRSDERRHHRHHRRRRRHRDERDRPGHSLNPPRKSRSRDRERDRDRERRRRSRSRSRERGDRNFKEQMRDALLQGVQPTNIVQSAGAGGTAVPLQRVAGQADVERFIAAAAQVPKYYNPGAVNVTKLAEQEAKRKLLWSKKPADDDTARKSHMWSSTAAVVTADEAAQAKFRKLMGIKGEETASGGGSNVTDVAQVVAKQERLFNDLDKEYTLSRYQTHSLRGVGLGFTSAALGTNPNPPSDPSKPSSSGL